MAKIYEVMIPCDICNEPHLEYAIDGHITVPHLCKNCWRRTFEEWEQELKLKNCSMCSHCTYVHEYETYFCTVHKIPIFGSLDYGLCESYEKNEEE